MNDGEGSSNSEQESGGRADSGQSAVGLCPAHCTTCHRIYLPCLALLRPLPMAHLWGSHSLPAVCCWQEEEGDDKRGGESGHESARDGAAGAAKVCRQHAFDVLACMHSLCTCASLRTCSDVL
jgi:hypothetical protein